MSQQLYQNPFVIKAIAACAVSQTRLARRCGGSVKQGHNRRPRHTPKLTTDACAALKSGFAGAAITAQMQADLFAKAVKIGGRGHLCTAAEGGMAAPLPLQMGAMP